MGCLVSSNLLFTKHLNSERHSPELEIFFWEHAEFLGPTDPGPPRIIPVLSIISQAARLAITKNIRDPDGYGSDEDGADRPMVRASQKLWVTIGLTMVCFMRNLLKMQLTDFNFQDPCVV